MRLVIKIGGTLGRQLGALPQNIARLNPDTQVLLVHGGSKDIEDVLRECNVPSERLTSPNGVVARYTSQTVLRCVSMALRGVTQPRIMSMLVGFNLKPVGLSGADGGIVKAIRKTTVRSVQDGRTRVIRDNHGGQIQSVDTSLLESLLSDGYLPVVCPPAADQFGQEVNVDADRFSAAIAVGWKADCLLLLTDTEGVRKSPPSKNIFDCIALTDIEPVIESVTGGMRMKLLSAQMALNGGVPRVIIASALVENPIDDALRGYKCTTLKR